ncbi:MAG: hypothetical protein ACRDLN_15995 [Solirubrobacteraceae bacterium]
MTHDDRTPPRAPSDPEDPVDHALGDLLAGPTPVNMVHGAIELGTHAPGAERPSQACIEAARNDILAALWGMSA